MQGLVCVHGFSDEKSKTVPVDGIFASINELKVEVDIDLVPANEGASEPVAIDTSSYLPHSESKRICDYISRLCQRYIPALIPTRVTIHSSWTPGWGIGSSAAIFASMAKAILSISNSSISLQCEEAKKGSYSAPASYLGGFSLVTGGQRADRPVAQIINTPDSMDLKTLVIPIDPDRNCGRKSSEQLHKDVPSSPYYKEWQQQAHRTCAIVIQALREGNITAMGAAVERYAFMNLAVMSTGSRNLMPWTGDTLSLLHFLRRIRDDMSLDFHISINSGPSLFALGHERTLITLRDVLIAQKLTKNVPILSDIGGPAERKRHK